VKVVINDSYRALYDAAHRPASPAPPAIGGETRQASVRNGLESLTGDAPDLVLIHDAARPFIDTPTIDRTIEALQEHQGALVAVQVVDTLKRADGKFSGGDRDRTGLWRAQTPQLPLRADPGGASHGGFRPEIDRRRRGGRGGRNQGGGWSPAS